MSRVRSSPQLLDAPFTGINYSQNRATDPNGTDQADSNFTYSGTRNKTMTDELTPSYYHNRRLGLAQPVQPMSQTIFKVIDAPLYSYEFFSKSSAGPVASTRFTGNLGILVAKNWKNVSAASMLTSCTSTLGNPSLRSLSALTTEAIARARTSQLDAGTFAAEFNKTIQMILRFRENTFGRAESIVRDLERTRTRKDYAQKAIRHAVSTFDQAWLEGRYGWRTLAYDLKDITDAVAKLKSGNWFSLERAYAKDEVHSVDTWSNNLCRIINKTGAVFNDWTYVSGSMTGTKTIQRRAGCIVEMAVNGIAFIDPLVTTWEVIPFSFILDWFLNVGKNISAFSPFAAGTLKGVWTSERTLIDYVFEGSLAPTNPNDSTRTQWAKAKANGTFKTQYCSYVRSKVTNPSFTLEYDLRLDWQKLVDLAAIASARYLGLINKIRKLNRI